MNTTLLFAELLIIGLQASLWLFLVAILAFGTKWLQVAKDIGLADWETLIVVIALSLVYTIGIIIDRFADRIFKTRDRKIRLQVLKNVEMPTVVIRFRLAKNNEYLNRQFEYTRSRMRISRASVFNFVMLLVVGLGLVAQHQFMVSGEKIKYIIFTLVGGLLLVLSAFYAWYRLSLSYYGLIKSHWEISVVNQGEKPQVEAPQSESSESVSS